MPGAHAAGTHTGTRRATATRWTAIACDALLFGLCSVFWSVAGIWKYDRFNAGMDLSIFDQAIDNLAHFHAPVSSMKTPGMNLWGDHFHPVIVLAVPFYWAWDDPRTLLVAQAVFIAAGAVVLARCARRHLGDRGTVSALVGLLVGFCFAFGSGVQSAAFFDMHEVALGVPLLAWAMSALVERRWTRATVLLLAFLLVKEDTPVMVAGFGLALLVQRQWRRGLLLVAAAVAWLELTTKVIIPALSPDGQWAYAGKVRLTPHVLATNLHHSLLGPGHLGLVLLNLVVASGLLSLCSPYLLPVLAMIASRAVVDKPEYWGYLGHYNLLPSLILAFATLDTVVRWHADGGVRRAEEEGAGPGSSHSRIGWLSAAIAARRARAATPFVVAVLLVWSLTGMHLDGAIRQARMHQPVRTRNGNAAVADVPAGVPVAADVFVTNHLTHSHRIVLQLAAPRFEDDLGHPVLPVVDWVVLDEKASPDNTYGHHPHWVRLLEQRLQREGWTQVDRHGQFVVWRRR